MIKVETFTGKAALSFAPDFARLSSICLAGWPFFVKPKTDQDIQNFIESLRPHLNSLHAVIVKDEDKVVGLTYGHAMHPLMGPLATNAAKFHKLERIYWIAQTTILPEYQGRGISHDIYKARDTWIIGSGLYDAIAHTIIVRPDDHPLKPKDHVPYGDMWGKRGYKYMEGMDVKSVFSDSLDKPKKPTEKTMQLWMRDLKNG